MVVYILKVTIHSSYPFSDHFFPMAREIILYPNLGLVTWQTMILDGSIWEMNSLLCSLTFIIPLDLRLSIQYHIFCREVVDI